MDALKTKEKLLYDKTQNVRIKKKEKETEYPLRITINLHHDSDSLKITITDENDPFLLYISEITPDVYKKIKQKLGLLVDFSQFPDHFVRILEQCSGREHRLCVVIQEEPNDPLGLGEGPCFAFKVTESNNFQLLCLIMLRMRVGTDKEVMNNMASGMGYIRGRCRKMEELVKISEEKIGVLRNEILKKDVELEEARSAHREEVSRVVEKSKNDILVEKRALEQAKIDFKNELNRTLSVIEAKHVATIASLQTEIDELKNSIQTLQLEKLEVEKCAKEKDEKISKFAKDIKLLQDEVQKSEVKISEISGEYRSKNANLESIKRRLGECEKDLEEKEKAVRKLTSLLDAAEMSKIHLKTSMKELSENFEKIDHERKSALKDLAKGNEIIAKMNSELLKTQNKLNVRTKITLGQEKVISEYTKKFQSLETENGQKDAHIENLTVENSELKSTVQKLREDLNARDEIIRKNEKLIGWLNEAITQQFNGFSDTKAPNVPLSNTRKEPSQNLESLEAPAVGKKQSLSQTAQSLFEKYSKK